METRKRAPRTVLEWFEDPVVFLLALALFGWAVSGLVC